MKLVCIYQIFYRRILIPYTDMKKRFFAIFLFALTTMFSVPYGASVTLAWDPNTEPDIAGYKLYYGSPVGTYSEVVNVGNTTNTTVDTLVSGNTYAFYVTCYNTSGLESEPSNVVEYSVPPDRVIPDNEYPTFSYLLKYDIRDEFRRSERGFSLSQMWPCNDGKETEKPFHSPKQRQDGEAFLPMRIYGRQGDRS